MDATPPRPQPTGQQKSLFSPASRPRTPNPTGRAAEEGRQRILSQDKETFQDLFQRSSKKVQAKPFKVKVPARISTRTIDTDTISRVNRASQRLSQFLYNLANEPSVGLYHVNDHIRRTVPKLVAIKKEIIKQKVQADKSSYDIDELIPTVQSISSLKTFSRTALLLQKSIQMSTAISSMPTSNLNRPPRTPETRPEQQIVSPRQATVPPESIPSQPSFQLNQSNSKVDEEKTPQPLQSLLTSGDTLTPKRFD